MKGIILILGTILPSFGFCQKKVLADYSKDTIVGNISVNSNNQFFKIELDQDVFNSKMNDDRDYTMGLCFQLGLNSEKIEHFRSEFRSERLKKQSNKSNVIPFLYTFTKETKHPYYLNTQYSLLVRGMAFTPDVIKTQIIQTEDRPFAGVTTFGISRSTLILSNLNDIKTKTDIKKLFNGSSHLDSFSKKKGTVRQSSFNLAIGFFGTNFYRDLQSGIHSLSNPTYKDTVNGENPFYSYGWVNQISPQGKITGSLQYGMNWLLTKQYFLKMYENPVNKKGFAEGNIHRIPWYQRRIECSGNTGFTIGYYNAISANFQLRVGKINPLKWMNSLNTLNNSNYTSNFSHKRQIADNFKGMELFVYANVGGHLMFYNALLRGQLISRWQGVTDTYVLSKEQVRPLFADINIGIGFSTNKFQVYYAPFVKRTSEVKLQAINHRNQYWGKIGIFINLNCEKK